MTQRSTRPVAVALEYEHGGVPRVTAKGRGDIADKIVALAEEAGVPIDHNGALAEALSKVELDSEIPVELYKAVAVVIGFALRVTGKLPSAPVAGNGGKS